MRGTKRERGPGVWELRVYVGNDPVTGAPRQSSRTFRGGTRAADTALAQFVAEVQQGKVSGTNATLRTLLKQYLDHVRRQGHSPKTLQLYEGDVDKHILPVLGDRPLGRLTAWDLDKLYAALADKGLSASTIRQNHAILSGALGQAVKWGWCSVNVAKMASPPVVRANRVVPPTPDDVRALVAKAEEWNPDLAALIMLAALTGARRGELCALRWTDVDLGAGTVRIARSLLDLNGQIEEKSTKTHQERTLALGDSGVALLQLHWSSMQARARLAKATPSREAFVFSEELDGSTPIRPEKVSWFFTRLRNKLDLPHIHLHSLRHFMATQLAAQGTVSARTLAGC